MEAILKVEMGSRLTVLGAKSNVPKYLPKQHDTK
jgi:hypothetical protein